MKYKLLYIFLALAAIFTSCDDSDYLRIESPREEQSREESLTLIYAVASNDLDYYFRTDTVEMIKAAEEIDLVKNVVLLYCVTRDGKAATLRRLVKSNKKPTFSVVKTYTKEYLSTDPKRISEVINDAISFSSATDRGVIFWSHATGWTPNFSDHIIGGAEKSRRDAIHRSFGSDWSEGGRDQCDIIEFAEAIPSDTFNYIWFDCCYMGSIEVVAELADKTPTIIGYPTEMGADGMPYNLTLPLLARKIPDILGASEMLFNSYRYSFCTIGVYSTAFLPDVAAAASEAYIFPLTSTSGIHNYGRRSNGPYLDFTPLTERWGEESTSFSKEALADAMSKFVVYKAATQKDFSNKTIDQETFSGITMHPFKDDGSAPSEYYKQLKWYRLTRK